MPVNPTYPGVYLQEVSSGVHTITGVATSITAFIGRARRGPVNEPITIFSYPDFVLNFGDLWDKSTMSYAVQQFYLAGGSQAIIVRVAASDATTASATLGTGANALKLEATGPGEWGNHLRVLVDHHVSPDKTDPNFSFFNLQVNYRTSNSDPGTTERFLNLSTNPSDPRYVKEILAGDSNFIRAVDPIPAQFTFDTPPPDAGNPDPFQKATPLTGGADGSPIQDTDIVGSTSEADKTGLFALAKVDLFNLLSIPPLTFDPLNIGDATINAALAYCQKRRAFFIMDPPDAWTKAANVTKSTGGINSTVTPSNYGGVFFPRVIMPDPLSGNRLSDFAPSGILAGIFTRTDAQRGVWKAPAGIEASLTGVANLSVLVNDQENGVLNQAGVNCLRIFSTVGPVSWGARTLRGADQLADDYKYIPVRRTALFIEESLYRGLQWAVFEPNDEPLWAQIRLNVGAFMQNLFRQGAFQGKTPREAYLVKCDKETTTQNDINLGIVNILVGFAPLKPAEFVIVTIQQLAGQIQV